MVIGIAGKIGSGKSTLSKLLAQDLKFGHASFGMYVRRIAESRNIALSRENLQNLGQELFENNLEGFCRGVLMDANWPQKQSVVLEGIRHIQVVQMLKNIAMPDSFKLVYLQIENDDIRQKRVMHRDENLSQIESHPSEEQLKSSILLTHADLVVDSQRSIHEQLEKIKSYLMNS